MGLLQAQDAHRACKHQHADHATDHTARPRSPTPRHERAGCDDAEVGEQPALNGRSVLPAEPDIMWPTVFTAPP
ncbi:hypothetical protein [Thauera sp. AutoDN2]|uniref:hypothetical protein n=1 Tax=Thauera sp. AutoDN2 TaxID=3416051 RepID=UPI003F4BD7CC